MIWIKKTENNGEHRKMNTNITREPAASISIQLHESGHEKGQMLKVVSGNSHKDETPT
jgi:hypothetical protein